MKKTAENMSRLRGMSRSELEEELVTLGRAAFQMRLQKNYNQLSDTNKIKENKRQIARIKLVLGEKAKEEAKSAGAADAGAEEGAKA